MASILDRLKRLGVGVKGNRQIEREANPGMNQFSTRGGADYKDIKQQEALNRQAGVTLKRFDGKLKSGEKLRNIYGVTYVVPVDSPEEEIRPPIPPMPADGMGGYGQGGDIRQAIPPMFAGGMGGYSQGGMFDPPSAPTRPDFSPQRPDSRAPVQQADSGMGMRTQEIIPVQPTDILDQELNALMRRIEGYSSQSTPVMPSRQGDLSMQTYQPQQGPMNAPGMFAPQQPNVPQGNMGSLIPGSFDGQLPMLNPTEYMQDTGNEYLQQPTEEEMDLLYQRYLDGGQRGY
jgi:hypothetical protein